MNKDVPQEKGFEEDIGRKGSENNASSEVFSKDKKKKIMFNVCATKAILAYQKEFDDRKQEENSWDPRDFKNLK